jgi:hypothetical protein
MSMSVLRWISRISFRAFCELPTGLVDDKLARVSSVHTPEKTFYKHCGHPELTIPGLRRRRRRIFSRTACDASRLGWALLPSTGGLGAFPRPPLAETIAASAAGSPLDRCRNTASGVMKRLGPLLCCTGGAAACGRGWAAGFVVPRFACDARAKLGGHAVVYFRLLH